MSNKHRMTTNLVSLTHDKALRQFLRQLQQSREWVGQVTGKSHIKLKHLSGAMVVIPSTPSDVRTVENTKRDIRKALRHESRTP